MSTACCGHFIGGSIVSIQRKLDSGALHSLELARQYLLGVQPLGRPWPGTRLSVDTKQRHQYPNATVLLDYIDRDELFLGRLTVHLQSAG
jgi:hypothetical protein